MNGLVLEWSLFAVIVCTLLVFDLFVFHRKQHEIKVRESLFFSACYITIGVLFGLWVWYKLGAQSGKEYLTGFVVEKTLSMDNIFLMSVIFSYFAIPRIYQHRVLFFGIMGAFLLRGILIGLGATIVANFNWVLYIFGAFLVLTGIKMLFGADKEPDIANNHILKFMKKHMRITHELHGDKFWVVLPNGRNIPSTLQDTSFENEVYAQQFNSSARRASGEAEERTHVRDEGFSPEAQQRGNLKCDAYRASLYFTPLFVALILIEIVDLIFAVDSVPAIFAITTDPYIVYTSNIFAILGLRALYFAINVFIHRFRYVQYALAIVLMFIGSKVFIMRIFGIHQFPASISLGVTIGVIGAGILYSLYKTRKEGRGALE